MIAHDSLDIPGGRAYRGGIARRSLPGKLAQVARERIKRCRLGVLFENSVELFRYFIYRLVPTDPLEFSRATLARATHGIHHARRFILHALDVAHGTQTGVGIPGTARHIARLDANELAVANGSMKMASRRAVHRAHGMNRPFLRRKLPFFGRQLVGLRAARAEPDGRCHGDGSDPLDERTTRKLAIAHEILGRMLAGPGLFIPHSSPFSIRLSCRKRRANHIDRRKSAPHSLGRMNALWEIRPKKAYAPNIVRGFEPQ